MKPYKITDHAVLEGNTRFQIPMLEPEKAEKDICKWQQCTMQGNKLQAERNMWVHVGDGGSLVYRG